MAPTHVREPLHQAQPDEARQAEQPSWTAHESTGHWCGFFTEPPEHVPLPAMDADTHVADGTHHEQPADVHDEQLLAKHENKPKIK